MSKLPLKAYVTLPGMISSRDGDFVTVQARVSAGPKSMRGRQVLVSIHSDALAVLAKNQPSEETPEAHWYGP